MLIYFELFLNYPEFDKENFKIFLNDCDDWSIYWHSLVSSEKKESLFYIRMKIKTEQYTDRLLLIDELIDIFESAILIACGYEDYWNIVLLYDGLVNCDRVYYFPNVTENSTQTFLSLHFVCLLDHNLWKSTMLPLSHCYFDKWQMYHWQTWSHIEKYYKGTIRHTKKSYIRIPFRINLGNISEFRIYEEFPLKIKFLTSNDMLIMLDTNTYSQYSTNSKRKY